MRVSVNTLLRIATELANIPDTPELRAADEAILSRAHSEKDSGDARERLKKRLDGIAALLCGDGALFLR